MRQDRSPYNVDSGDGEGGEREGEETGSWGEGVEGREREEGNTKLPFFNSIREILRAKLFTREQRIPES